MSLNWELNIAFISILVFGYANGRLKEVESCMLESLKPSARKFLYLSDLKILATAAFEFQLLPNDLQNLLRECKNSQSKGSCHDKLLTGRYEDCGIFIVEKCPRDYNRVDCSICAKKCPEGSLADAGGMLCQKPRILKRKQIVNRTKSKENLANYDIYDKFMVEKCPQNFVPLGVFMCTLECPEDFVDKGTYCQPPTIFNNDYCMNTFDEEVNTDAQK
jgi:hypothetical protein